MRCRVFGHRTVPLFWHWLFVRPESCRGKSGTVGNLYHLGVRDFACCLPYGRYFRRSSQPCGSGVATSTLAADEVKSVCAEYGITAFKINKCSMAELSSEMAHADIVLTTNNYKGDIGKPHMSVAGFVTGINEGALRKKLGELLTELANS